MSSDHVDVLIVGAGISGIGAACHLRAKCKDKTFTILEARDAIGGTWDLFRYPGVRSDSDMFTLGYSFRPWTGEKAIADGDSIRTYIRETAGEFGVDKHIRYHHRVLRAEWSTADARWTVYAERTDTGEQLTLTCDFLFGCTGYYRYDEGYTPALPGIEKYAGRVVHPQHWPEDLDHAGKRVVVIGSGATAVTIVPAMAEEAAHVTMLQRSPSYVLSLPATDSIADRLRRWLPTHAAYDAVRWKNVRMTMLIYGLSRRRPETMKRLLRKGATSQLPEGFDVDTHFNPRYAPWDQRLCLAPNGDIFAAIKAGNASVVTDTIETFTEKGIRLASGTELEADIVVTATGLNLLALGGMELVVDGKPIDVPNTVAYKGLMLCGVPNLALTIGYINASWTLRADLVCDYVTRLLRHMDAGGYRIATPVPPPTDERVPILDLTSGYVQRGLAAMPKQGTARPWRMQQHYLRDRRVMRRGRVDDEGIRFSHGPKPVEPAESAAAGKA
jgi:monooxygenase